MSIISEMPKVWAEKEKQSEATAFEKALKKITPEEIINKLETENLELRKMLKRQEEDNRKLREALFRQQEDFYD